MTLYDNGEDSMGFPCQSRSWADSNIQAHSAPSIKERKNVNIMKKIPTPVCPLLLFALCCILKPPSSYPVFARNLHYPTGLYSSSTPIHTLAHIKILLPMTSKCLLSLPFQCPGPHSIHHGPALGMRPQSYLQRWWPEECQEARLVPGPPA